MFQPIYICFKRICNRKHISACKIKGLFDKIVKPPATSAALNYINNKIRIKFYGSYLKQDKIIFNHNTVKNINI